MQSVRLVDDLQQFNPNTGLTAVLTDNTDFLVVGIIGMQGSGKSSLMNHLAYHLRQTQTSTDAKTEDTGNKENQTLNEKPEDKSKAGGNLKTRGGYDRRDDRRTGSPEPSKDYKSKERSRTALNEGTTITSKELVEVFREQSFEKQMLAEHCTSGIKAWISPTTRVIFLDSQPLNSVSVLGKYDLS